MPEPYTIEHPTFTEYLVRGQPTLYQQAVLAKGCPVEILPSWWPDWYVVVVRKPAGAMRSA